MIYIHRYIELDTEKSLVWNLQELELVENPTIAIIHKHHSGFFVEGKSDSLFYSNTNICVRWLDFFFQSSKFESFLVIALLAHHLSIVRNS